MYYLRTKPAVNAIQYTVDKHDKENEHDQGQLIDNLMIQDDETVCINCSA